VRALAIEKLRASYENRVMELEEKLYGILEADATRQ
jgi:outer membrane receptor for ferric coprogen and ferric-rhodotorulic acid